MVSCRSRPIMSRMSESGGRPGLLSGDPTRCSTQLPGVPAAGSYTSRPAGGTHCCHRQWPPRWRAAMPPRRSWRRCKPSQPLKASRWTRPGSSVAQALPAPLRPGAPRGSDSRPPPLHQSAAGRRREGAEGGSAVPKYPDHGGCVSATIPIAIKNNTLRGADRAG
jgi:hypothetical protein